MTEILLSAPLARTASAASAASHTKALFRKVTVKRPLTLPPLKKQKPLRRKTQIPMIIGTKESYAATAPASALSARTASARNAENL